LSLTPWMFQIAAVVLGLQAPSGQAGGSAAATGPAVDGLDTDTSLRWLSAPPAWLLWLVIVPGVLAFCWWSYRKEASLTGRQRVTLAVLRACALFVVLLASFRPALQTTRNLKIRREVHFLIDDSASMNRHETYNGAQAAAIRAALGSDAPSELSSLSRSELVGLFFGGEDMRSDAGVPGQSRRVSLNDRERLDRAIARAPAPGKKLLETLAHDFDLRWFRFSDRSSPIADFSELTAKAPMTRIGDSIDLHQTSNSIDSGKLDSIIVITDGRNTGGLPPTESAARLAASEIPVHVIGVGDPTKERNLTLAGPPGPQQVLQNEEAVFELNVSATGIPEQTGRLTLRAERRSGSEPATTAGSHEIDFPMPPEGESRKVSITYSFDEPGDYLLTFEVPPFPEESNPTDNITRRYVRVDSDKIRVLYLEEQPRWEYKYIYQALRRVDKSIQVQCFLFEASDSFPQEHSEGLPSLERIPRTKAELFKYHVILIGDVAPYRFGKTEQERNEWFDLVKDFVENGGGLGLISGVRYMPLAYRDSTIEDLLPVVIDLSIDDNMPSTGTLFRPMLENPHLPHPIVRLNDDPDVNRRLWKVGLKGMYWYFPVLRPKAGATVLLRHPFDQNKYGHRVLTCIAPYPRGKVFFSAIDSVWRWRNPYGELYVDRYWRQVVRSLAENKLRRKDDRVELTVDRETAVIDARVRAHLRLLDEDYNPVVDEKATLFLRTPDGKVQSLELPRLQGQAGEFDTQVALSEPGVFSFLYYADGVAEGRPLARQDVIVRVPEKELQHASMNEADLRRLAEAGGGIYAPLHEMDHLLAGFEDRGAGFRMVDRRRREIWDAAWTVLLVLTFLSIEWVLRKRWRLV